MYNVTKPAIEKLIQVQMPVRTSFEIAKLVSVIQGHLSTFENVRNGLIAQYGDTDARTGRPVIDQQHPNWPKFIAEYKELEAIEVELTNDKITIPLSVNGRDIEIEPRVLMSLEKLIGVE